MPGGVTREFARFRARLRGLMPFRLFYPRFGDLDAFCAGLARELAGGRRTCTLDLGCGPSLRNPFHAGESAGIDIVADPARNVRAADLAVEPIPFADSAFDYVTAYDFLEHVPRVLYAPSRRFPFIELMNEIHRVLRPGGLLLSHTPAYPYAPAFQDPTHVNIITEDTFPVYFAGELRGRYYGFTGAFEIIRQGWVKPHLITVLRKSAGPGASTSARPEP